MVGVGQVSVPADGNAEYHVRDAKNIVNFIIPIFDKYPLLTSKYFSYELFRQAALIFNNKNISISERDLLLSELKLKKRPENYISPA
jgi:LAGLIDADG endonuclease